MLVLNDRPFTGRRLRARRVNEQQFAEHLAERARTTDDWVIGVTHGGDVANNYKYYAETECVLAVSDPFGVVLLWCARTAARGVTKRAAARACLPGVEDIFDARVGGPRKEAARQLLLKLHNKIVPAMAVIAAATG